MKKLFVQFYLLLFVCFLVMTLLVGLVYKFTAERAGRQSLDDLMKSSLYLMRSELREIPPREWGKTLKEMDLNLSFDLRVEPLNHYKLDAATTQRLREGDIWGGNHFCTDRRRYEFIVKSTMARPAGEFGDFALRGEK